MDILSFMRPAHTHPQIISNWTVNWSLLKSAKLRIEDWMVPSRFEISSASAIIRCQSVFTNFEGRRKWGIKHFIKTHSPCIDPPCRKFIITPVVRPSTSRRQSDFIQTCTNLPKMRRYNYLNCGIAYLQFSRRTPSEYNFPIIFLD